jgi:hypothetical protein
MPGRLQLSDTTQGQAPDVSLFREALDAPTLDRFENPEIRPDAKPEVKQETEPKPEVEAPVPSARLREESEARRRLERERDELRARLAAFEVQPKPQPQQKLDVFDNPSAFVQQEVSPLLNEIRAELQLTRENASAQYAASHYGPERVDAARSALQQGLWAGDPNAKALHEAALRHPDPYGLITRWFVERETLNTIGGDLEQYNQRTLQEALKNPDFLKQALEALKGQAAASGSMINRAPVTQSKVPTLPSLSDIGAAGGDEGITEASDEALFRAAVSAKRRS